MKKFGFICHPLDFDQLSTVDASLQRKSPRLIRQVMAQVPPSRVRTIHLRSPNGAEVTCELICVWLLPDQFRTLDRDFVARRLRQAIELAASLGCEMVGLGAYTKMIAHGDHSPNDFPIPVTTGNTLTSALAIESFERVMVQRRLLRDQTEMAIVGANGAIGNAVLRALGPQVKRLNLVGRSPKSLERTAQEAQSLGCQVQVYDNAKSACCEADLIFLATSEPGLLIQARDLSWGTCVVDVSKPVNILPDRTRQDVQIIDCAMVTTPPRVETHNHVRCFPKVEGLDSQSVFACFAETMILALEGRFESYSFGRRLELSRCPEILRWMKKHGFTQSEAPVEGPWKYEWLKRSTTLKPVFGIAS